MEDKDYLLMDEDDVQNWLDSDETEEFRITNDGLADWAIEKIVAEQNRTASYCNVIDNKIKILQEQKATEQHKLEARTSFLTRKLNEYLDITPNTKQTKTAKSLAMPSGTVKRKFERQVFRAVGSKDIKTNENVINYCKQNAPDLVDTTETVKWAELKKRLTILDNTVFDTATGEEVPSIAVDIEPIKVVVE